MTYNKVKEDFVVACLVGTTKSNHSYGSSRIYKPLPPRKLNNVPFEEVKSISNR